MKKLITYIVLLAVFLSGCVKDETQHSAMSENKYATENVESTETKKAEKPEKIEPDNTTTEIVRQKNTNLPDDAEAKKTTDNGKNPQTIDITNETQQPEESKVNMCTISVSCESVLNNMDKLDKNKVGLIPSDGIILPKQTVEICSGESVFDITLKVMKDKKIHFEFVKTAAFNSAYIKGIGNIYEFDCGELSGWRYRINGEIKGYGCSQYYPENGDIIEWIYVCE